MSLYATAFARAHKDVAHEVRRAEMSASPAQFAEGADQILAATIPQNVLEPYSQMAFNLAGEVADDLRDDATRLMQTAIAQGASADEIEAQLDGLFANYIEAGLEPLPGTGGTASVRSSARLENIVRTEFSKAYNTGRNAIIFDPDVDVVTGVQFSAIMDSRTTEICRAWDDIVFGKDDRDAIARHTPPLHFQALPSGTLIETEHGATCIEAIEPGMKVLTHAGRYRRVYSVMGKPNESGTTRMLVTSSGRVLLITDEHPVLTRLAGWKRADKVLPGDEVFEDSEQFTEPFDAARAQIAQGILTDAHNNPAFLDEPSITWKILRVPGRMAAAVNLKIDHPGRESEVEDVSQDAMLKDERNAGAGECRENDGLVSSGLRAISMRKRISDSLMRLRVMARVAFDHALRMAGIEQTRVLAKSVGPVFASTLDVSASIQGCRLSLASDRYAVSMTPSHQDRLPDPKLALQCAERLAEAPMLFGDERIEGRSISEIYHRNPPLWRTSAIISNAVVECKGYVWNLAVEQDETYVAGGIVVHNCRSMLVPVTIYDEDIKPTPRSQWPKKPEQQPMTGFGGVT